MNTPQASIIDQIADERDELRDENIRLKHRIKLLEEYETRQRERLNERDELRQENQRLREPMEIMMSAVSHVERIAKERDDANERINQLVLALRRIANTDYRSTESRIAGEALGSKP